MPRFQIHVMCNECSSVHPLPITLHGDDLPDVERAVVGDVYQGIALPPTLAMLQNNGFTCPESGRQTPQKDNNQIFLVRMS
jgi:hypothetical protein